MASTPKKGFFVVLEGIDGSGTTTQIKLVSSALRRNYNVLRTREPSDGPIGVLIRQILSGRIETDRSDSTMALLFAADRMDHVNRVIKPALNRGQIVLCDRYYYSTLAYQSNDERSEEFARRVNGKARPPDLTIVLDVELEEAQRRLESRIHKDYTEALDIQKRVQAWYRNIHKKFWQKIITLDANGDPNALAETIRFLIERTLDEDD